MFSLLLKPPFSMWDMKAKANTHDWGHLAYSESASGNVTIAMVYSCFWTGLVGVNE